MSREAKREFWLRHIQACQASEVSQAAYCQAHALSMSSFGYWRKRCVPATTSSLTVVPVVREPGGSGVQLRSPSGWQISLPASMSSDALLSVLTALP